MYNRKSVRIVTPPSSVHRAVTVDDMKMFLRVTDTIDDKLIGSLIDAATNAIRNWLWRAVLKETLELTIDRPGLGDDGMVALGPGVHTISRPYVFGMFPNDIDLPYPPILTVNSITTFNQSNVSAVYPSQNYLVSAAGRITLNQNASWPSNLRDSSAMVINYDAGYDAKNVPDPIVTAIKFFVSSMYECREACEMPQTCQVLLQPYRLYDPMGLV